MNRILNASRATKWHIEFNAKTSSDQRATTIGSGTIKTWRVPVKIFTINRLFSWIDCLLTILASFGIILIVAYKAPTFHEKE